MEAEQREEEKSAFESPDKFQTEVHADFRGQTSSHGPLYGQVSVNSESGSSGDDVAKPSSTIEMTATNLKTKEIDPDKVKPVSKIVIENENVPQIARPDGRPVPRPFRLPMRCRIYPTILSCYTSWNCLTTMAMFGSFMGALINDFAEPQCFDKMGLYTAILLGVLCFNCMIGFLECLWTIYLVHERAPTEVRRMYLGRCLVMTSTSRNKLMYGLAYIMDGISLACLVAMFAILPTVSAHCKGSVLMFYEIAIAMQSLVFVRMFLVCVHYSDRHKPFYKWLKRQFKCL